MKMNKKGFTIVELVIVIAVIAILAGVLIPTFSSLVQKAQDSAAIQEARNKYTEYVGLHDYSDGTEPDRNIVIEIGDGKDAKYVVVIDGQLQDKVYKDKEDPADAKADAKAVAKYKNVPEAQSAAAFLCEKHEDNMDDAGAQNKDKICDDCGKCETHAFDKDAATPTGKCTVCGAECDKTHEAGVKCDTCGVTKQ